MSERKGKYLARLLIRHNIIHRAVIDDPEGYDRGHTLAAVVEASEELGIDELRAEIERLKAERLVLAKLASDKPEFYNPLAVYDAKELRERILAEAK